MEATTVFLFLSAIVMKVVDFTRNAFDKFDRIPKAWWNLYAWAVGAGIAWIACTVDAVALRLHVPQGQGCVGFILTGLGLGSVAALLHEVASRLSVGSKTPKGLLPRRAAADEQ